MSTGEDRQRSGRRRVLEGVIIVLATAVVTVTASIVAGGFGLAGNAGDGGSPPGPVPTATVTVTAQPQAGPLPPAGGTPSSATRGTPSSVIPRGLAVLAEQTLRERPGSAFGTSVAVTPEAKGATREITHAGSSPLQWKEGQEYELAALCMGRGKVTVQWEAPGGVTGSLPVTCGDDGRTARVRFTARADGEVIRVKFMPNREAMGQAGIAVDIIEFY